MYRDNEPPADPFAALTTGPGRLDPYPLFAAYRRQRPVVDTGVGVRFFFRYADCLALLRDQRLSVDERSSPLNAASDPTYPTLIKTDPPDHDRLRRLVQAAFSPRRIDAMRSRTEQLVDTAVAELRDFGSAPVDLLEHFAYPVPLTVICELLGVDSSAHAQVREWSAVLAQSIDPRALRSPELSLAIDSAEAEFAEYIRTLIALRRRRPGPDLLSQLVAIEGDRDRLSEAELLGLALLLLIAGHETTVNLIGNGMLALLTNPDQFRVAITSDVARHRMLVDELLRFDSPVQLTTRIAKEDLLVGEHFFRSGDIAVLFLGSANRDGDAFDNSDSLSVHVNRSNAHLSFGQGIHHCLGAALARSEGEIAVPALLRAFPHMRLVEEPQLRSSFVLRGRSRLLVELH
jgi:cytochrome P450